MSSWLLKLQEHQLSVGINDAAVARDQHTVKRLGAQRRELKIPIAQEQQLEREKETYDSELARWDKKEAVEYQSQQRRRRNS